MHKTQEGNPQMCMSWALRALVAQQVAVKMHDKRWVLPKKPHRGDFITAVSFIVSNGNHPLGKVIWGVQSARQAEMIPIPFLESRAISLKSRDRKGKLLNIQLNNFRAFCISTNLLAKKDALGSIWEGLIGQGGWQQGHSAQLLDLSQAREGKGRQGKANAEARHRPCCFSRLSPFLQISFHWWQNTLWTKGNQSWVGVSKVRSTVVSRSWRVSEK